MSEHGTLTVNLRSTHGKGAARRLRAEGLVPAVLYGGGKDNVSLSLDPRALQRAMHPERRYNTLLTLTIEGGASVVTESTLIAEYDTDKLRGVITHVDFLRVDPKAPVEREIPVSYTGKPVGVSLGGQLQTTLRSVRISAPAGAIPVALEVDVTSLQVGQGLRVRDLSVPGATVLERPDQTLAHVSQPKAEKEEVPAEGVVAAADATPEAAAAETDADKDKPKDKKK